MHFFKAAGLAALASCLYISASMANPDQPDSSKGNTTVVVAQNAQVNPDTTPKTFSLKKLFAQKASVKLAKSRPLGTAPWICTPSGFGALPHCYAR